MSHTFLLLALLPAQGADDAEQLFKKMESQVAKAKAFEMSFDVAIEGLPGKDLKGSLAATTGKKARIEFGGEIDGKTRKMVTVSNGRVTKSVTVGEPGSATQKTPDGFEEMIRASVTRAGVVLPLFVVEPAPEGEKSKEFKLDEQVAVSEFKLGKREKIGEREAHVIEHKLKLKPAREPFAVTLWIDSKTALPLKRVVAGELGGQKIKVTETYSKLTLDGKVDESKFVLPK